MKKVAFVTLGCAKNTVLTEYMMGVLENSHYETTKDLENADAIVINTCGFINDAKEESINMMIELANLKKNKHSKIISLGCLVQKYADELHEALPEVDLFLGSTEYDHIIKHLDSIFEKKVFDNIHLSKIWPKTTSFRREILRQITTPNDYAYLMISEGCNNRCAYCSIPEMQGPYRSRPKEDIVTEAKALVLQGYKELVIIAQDTTYYGKDLYNKFCLDELLEDLAKIENLKWIRILYAYPNNFTDNLIDVMAKYKNICHYIDIPLQHASNSILKSMHRNITKEEIISLINKLRKKMPDVVLRSTFISGFPGETEADHNELLDFLQTVKLDRVGVFPYSQEDKTPAGKMTNQIAEEIKESRAEELMEIQFDVMIEKHKLLIGKILEVKIDSIENDLLYTRSYGEAPVVDPFIILNNIDKEQMENLNEYFFVRIIDIDGYDLIGELL